MDITELLEPIVRDGIRTTHFFNGRVLTAEDLRTEQHANRDQRRQLGRALGAGVAHGLEVTAAAPIDGIPAVRIRAGLAFNRDGDAIELSRTVTLRLVTRATDVPPDAGLFAVCMAPQQPLELTNIGLYVLSARPASAFSSERAPMTDLGSEGVGASCGSRWAVAGVRFGVAPLPIAPTGTTATPLGDELVELVKQIEGGIEKRRSGGAAFTAQDALDLARNLSRLRNGAAYLCFGVDQQNAQHARPLPAPPAVGFPDPTWGAIDGMRGREEIAPCEVPLAVFYLGRDGVEWVDMWAARRPVVPAATAGTLPVLPDRRRQAEAFAMLLQFQNHVADLAGDTTLTPTQLGQIRAHEFFAYLPPIGLLPVQGPGVPRAYTAANFLAGLAGGPAVSITGSRVGRLVAEALFGPPVDLATAASVELYRVQQNLPTATSAPPPYVVVVNRDTQGARARDPVTAVLEQVWAVYRGLLKRRLFIPLDGGSDATAARISVPAAVQAITGPALRYATLAAARRLPVADAIESFARMHELQQELADLLATGLSGVPDTQDRAAFATQLNGLLNTTLPGGGLPLAAAVTQENLLAAVQAQQAINQFVGSWSGEGAAMGFVDVSYVASPDGDNLVIGSPDEFNYRFEVANHTDKSLTLALEAGVIGGGVDWTGQVTIRRTPGGAPIEQVGLAPAAKTDVFVAIRVPAGAQEGPATVTLTASTGAPHDKTDTAHRALTLATEAAPPVTRSIQIVSIVPEPADVSVSVEQLRSYEITLLYTAVEGPESASFRLRLMGTVDSEAEAAEWFVGFFGGANGTLEGTTRTAVTTHELTAGETAANIARAQIRAPFSAGSSPKAIIVQLVVESAEFPPEEALSAESSTWTLTLPASS